MRTEQDLLAERRVAALEAARETDKTARSMLLFRVEQIDRELHERREKQPWRPSDGGAQ